MAITKERKEELVKSYVELLSGSRGIILTDYQGLTVSEIQAVRNRLREFDAPFHVVKNTLLRLALEKAGLPVPTEQLGGTVAVSFCHGELPATAKTMIDLAKEFDALEVRGGLLGDRLVTMEGIKALADLPPREVLLAQVVGSFQAPISGLVSALSGILRGLVYVLQARKEQLENSGA